MTVLTVSRLSRSLALIAFALFSFLLFFLSTFNFLIFYCLLSTVFCLLSTLYCHHLSSVIHNPSSIINHPSSIIHHPSSIIHHLIGCPSLEQGWISLTSLISNYVVRRFYGQHSYKGPPFRDGLITSEVSISNCLGVSVFCSYLEKDSCKLT